MTPEDVAGLLDEKITEVIARVTELENLVGPWIGVDGQLRFRLERLEQAFQAYLNHQPAADPGRQAAHEMFAAHR